jgi:hypothetical protein
MLPAADPPHVLSSRAQSRDSSNQAPTMQIKWRDQSPFARSFAPLRRTRESSVARYFAAPTEDLRFRAGSLGFLDVAGAIVKK